MNTNRALLTSAVAMALTILIGACAPVTSYTDAEAPKHIKLDSATTQVDLRFAPGSAQLSPVDAARLRELAARGEITGSDRVTVAAAGGPELARQRVASVSALLLHYGVVPVDAPTGGVLPNHAIVAVGRTLVTLPPCPNWSKPSGTDFANQPSSNFGCATETNLGMMIANPSDLASGLPNGPMPAQPLAAAVNRYVNDKVTPLPSINGASPFSAAASAPTAAAPSNGAGSP
ncbi:MAG TPA: CpaD family pilus assembly lipoprotein [Stellaceae bacterium]|jgi:pilus assembly protein CpaD|nr:CpaD family pilus assembly lipoprotein [Stellaceae bacterium]